MRARSFALGVAHGVSGAIGLAVLAGMALSPMVRALFGEAGAYGFLIVAWATCSVIALALFLARPHRPQAEALGAGRERLS